MEDAAVQAGITSGRSRSSQTPRLSTPRPTTSSSDGIWDLLRTQSLPSDSQEWLTALVSNRSSTAEFGDAAAEYALTVSSQSRLCTCIMPRHQKYVNKSIMVDQVYTWMELVSCDVGGRHSVA